MKIVALGNLSNPANTVVPELVTSVKAAAAAVTKSCEIGRPVEVTSCDDKFNPNSAAACARKAVADEAVAVVPFSGLGDSFMPVLAKAGIPVVRKTGSPDQSIWQFDDHGVPQPLAEKWLDVTRRMDISPSL